ncbi:MAG: lysophospholipase [Pseudomonadota bacterium]
MSTPLPPTLTTADGLKLQVREWPAAAEARGTVLIVHGLGEHAGRYAHVAAHLVDGGHHVVAYDHRGHGDSDGPRGRLHHPDDLLRDLARVIDAVRAAHPGPLVLLGHSMGGAIAARMVAAGLEPKPPKWHRLVDALVLSSPALDIGLGGAQKALLAVLGRVAPNFAIGNGLEPEWVSRDPAVVAAYIDDPLVHDRVTAKLVRFMADAGAFVRAHAAQWRVPTLLVYAGADRCVVPAGSAAFAKAAPASVVTVLAFPGLYHELFNEPEQAQVFAVLADWLAAPAH